jgi:hypothetical protein
MSRKVAVELPFSEISKLNPCLSSSDTINLSFTIPLNQRKNLENLAKENKWDLKIFTLEQTNFNSDGSSFISDGNSVVQSGKNCESNISEQKNIVNGEKNKVFNKKIQILDTLKRIYLEKKKKFREIEENYFNEKLKIIFEEDNSISISAEDNKCLIKVIDNFIFLIFSI